MRFRQSEIGVVGVGWWVISGGAISCFSPALQSILSGIGSDVGLEVICSRSGGFDVRSSYFAVREINFGIG
jgi:hypothetical protein